MKPKFAVIIDKPDAFNASCEYPARGLKNLQRSILITTEEKQ